ncbi:hypothetical protein ACJ72_07677, partial [Emergomyces africanus]
MAISANYTPDPSAILTAPWTTVQLSERDTSSQIPINYVTYPGVYVTAACFGNKIYEEQAMVTCISNLIAVDTRRFYIDLYWSPDHRRWTLCPVVVDSNAPDGPASTETAASGKSSSMLADAGSYSCSGSLDLSVLLHLLHNYFFISDDTLNAHMLYILLNIHFATPKGSSNPPSRAPARNKFPSGKHLLGSLFGKRLAPYMYTPKQLQEERANLNRSWYSVPRYAHPIAEYFTTHKDAKGDHSTPDGWPCERYVERHRFRRCLVGWGAVDNEMEGYNFAGDGDFIFPRGSLAESQTLDISYGSGGNDSAVIKSGCLFDPHSTDSPGQSASWAESTVAERHDSDLIHSLNRELVAC